MAVGKAFDISLIGDKKLVKTLKRLDFKLQKKYLAQSMRRGFKITHKAIKQEARSFKDTGALFRSIKLRKGKAPRGMGRRMIVFRIFTGGRDVLGIEPTMDVGSRGGKGTGYYPYAIEFGYTKQNGEDVPPRSFMRGPLKATKKRVLQVTGQELWSRINAFAKSAGK